MSVRHIIVRPGNAERYELTVRADEVLDMGFDWSRILRGDPIATSQWTVPSELTQAQASSIDTTETKTTVWPQGYSAGSCHELVNRITTDGGRVFERKLQVRVEPQ